MGWMLANFHFNFVDLKIQIPQNTLFTNTFKVQNLEILLIN